MSLQPGDRLGDWVIERPLGQGGMGSVYRCHSVLADDVLAAVKVLEPNRLGDGRGRFVQELRTLSALRHPHIVQVQGGGHDEGRNLLYMAMELVDGEDLSRRLERGPLSPDEGERILGAVADALAHAHDRGVAHRDIKPANIMLRADGSPVVVDFGIAVAEGEKRFTREGLLPGTAAYLPPEVFKGVKPDPRHTDAYAVGLVAYEALTGTLPFAPDPDSSEGEQLARLTGMKLGASALDPGETVPSRLRTAILRTTDPDPARRLVKMDALRDLLTSGEATLDNATFGLLAPEAPRKMRLGMKILLAALLLLAGGLFAIGGLVIGVGTLWLWSGSPPEPPPRAAVALSPTLESGTRALDGGDLRAARRSASAALDDHPGDPHANLLYGQVLLASGQGALARPYLCAAASMGLGERVPGLASGALDCEPGPGAARPLTAPLALARLDLGEEVAALATEGTGLAEPVTEEEAVDEGPVAAAPPEPTTRASRSRPRSAPSGASRSAPPPAPAGEGAAGGRGAPSAPDSAGGAYRAARVQVHSGPITEAQAMQVLRRHAAFARCTPSTAGSIRLRIEIEEDGSVRRATILQGTGAATCLVAQTSGLAFPAGGSVDVVFAPG